MAIMTIIIKAIDKASEVARKVGQDTSNQMDKIAQATEKARQAGDRFTGVVIKEGQSGMSAFAQLNGAQLDYINKVTKASGLLDRMGLSGTKAGNAILRGMDLVHNGINRVESGVDTLKQRIASTTVGNKLITGFNTVKQKISEVTNSVRTGFAQGLDNAKSKVESLNNSMGTLGQAVTSVFGAVGLGSVYQATIGLAMTREQMTSLMTATMGSADAAKGFVGTLDQMTNNSLVSLNELGNAMSQIKMATGMSNDELQKIAPTVNDIGQRALLMGKDTGEAQELMSASFRGLNGEFDMLQSNFGITRQSLIDAGWSGAATDVEGYNKALQTCLERGGDMNGMMNTTPGLIKQVEKGFSIAGRQIGETFIPVIQTLLSFMLYLKDTNPLVLKLVIVAGALVSAFALALPVLGSVIGGFKSFLIFLDLIQGAEDATTIKTVASTAARWANTAATYASAAAHGVLNGALALYTFATSGNVTATVASTASRIAHAVASGAAAAATGAMTAATWLLNTALNANPIAIVVIAIVALIAILAILYNKNETVRNAINWLWNGLKQLGGWIAGGLVAAWNSLTTALKPITDALLHLSDVVVGRLLVAWQGLMKTLAPIGAAFAKLWAAITGGASSGANSTFTQLVSTLTWLWNIIVQVATILWDVFSPALTAIAGVITGFFGASLQTVAGILGGVIQFIATLIDILSNLIEGNITFQQAMQQVWGAVQVLFLTVINSILGGIGKFALNLVNKGVTAAMNFVNNLRVWFQMLPTLLWMYLYATYMKTVTWGSQLVNKAKEAGSKFLAGIIVWFRMLPVQIWMYLNMLIQRAINWKNQMVARAKETGSNFLNSVINFISQLPGRAWTWLINTISRIVSFASQAWNSASQAGSNIVNAIADYLTGLPGRMYQWGLDALNSFVNAIINSIPGLRDALNMVSSLFPHSPPKEGPLSTITNANMEKFGEGLGDSFAQGINDSTTDIWSNLTPPTPTDIPVTSSPAAGATASMTTSPTQSATTASMAVDTAALAEGNQQAEDIVAGTVTFVNSQYGLMQTDISQAWQNMATTSQTGFTGIKNNMQTTLNQVVANNQLGYTKLKSNTASTLNQIVTNNQLKYNQLKSNTAQTVSAMVTSNKTSYNSMQKSLANTLTNIKTDNQNKYKSIYSTTSTTLNNLQNKTNNSMKAVTGSWGDMRDSLTSAAETTKNNVESSISNLSSNIGSFYNKIQNPSLFLAGPVPYRYRRRLPAAGHMPRPGRRGASGPGATPSALTRKEVNRFENSAPVPCTSTVNCHYAGWDFSDPWTTEIMDYVNNYVPTFGDLGSMGLHVSDFTNSDFPVMGNPEVFKAMAAKLIGPTSYQFYYDSDGMSPLQNIQRGSFNCVDGALILIALANAMGLGGSLHYGTWYGSDGVFGHAFAYINGVGFMDTTAYQDGYGWTTSKVSYSGPGPSSSSISSGFNTVDTGNTSSEFEVHEVFDLNLNLKFEGLPDGIDENSLKAWLMTVINDSDVVNALIKNRRFQDWLKIEMDKKDRRDKRARGAS